MNTGLAYDPKSMQDVLFEVSIQNKTGRLPLIVIQTPAEVEAGLCKYWSNDGQSGQQNHENYEKREHHLNQTSVLNKDQSIGICNFAETPIRDFSSLGFSHNNLNSILPSFQLSNEKHSNIGICSEELKTRRPNSRRSRITRIKAKKGSTNEQKSMVEDALLAFKKMKLNTEEDEAMD